MNGYAVYKVQTRSSIKDKQVKEISPFTYKLTCRLNCNPVVRLNYIILFCNNSFTEKSKINTSDT